MPAGETLKRLRNKRNITVRDVEQASRRIAEVKGGDKRFFISNGWLAQLENGVSEPSICKLFSLSVIYHEKFLDLVQLYNVDVADKEKYEPVAHSHLTQLISEKSNHEGQSPSQIFNRRDQLSTTLMPELKVLNPKQLSRADGHPAYIVYGHLGLADFTMYPMIRPGALLKINTGQNKLVSAAWRNEYERPIFFIELRDAYACGWCDLQGNQLLIIPHHSSPAGVRNFTYRREAEIVGRVIGYSTNCFDLESETVKISKRKIMAGTNSST